MIEAAALIVIAVFGAFWIWADMRSLERSETEYRLAREAYDRQMRELLGLKPEHRPGKKS